MKPVVFVLSSGRAGTHFVAEAIRRACGNQVEAYHERLTAQACPRRLFRRYDLVEEYRHWPAVRGMVDAIHETTRRLPYIDTGWPLHSLFPLLLQEFAGRIRLVMQLRHPLDSSASLAVRGAYDSTADPEGWTEHCFIHPTDNAAHPDVPWDSMSRFEKNLWRWVELISYWNELQAKFPKESYQVIRSEDLFTDEATLPIFFRLLGLDVPPASELRRYTKQAGKNENSIDLRCWYGIGSEWRTYFQYEKVLKLAEQFGYSSEPSVIERKVQKYARPGPLVRFRAGVARVWRRYRSRKPLVKQSAVHACP